MQPNSHDHPDYIEALKRVENDYRAFLVVRDRADTAANGIEHYDSAADKALFNKFLESKARFDELHGQYFGSEIHL
jgi:hypothetical protein